MSSRPFTPPPRPTPAPLRIAAVTAAAPALGALVFAVLEVVGSDADRIGWGIGGSVAALAYGVFLVVIGRGLWRARRWSRGAAAATSLLHLLLAWSLLGGTTVALALGLGGLAVATLVLLFLPLSNAALSDGGGLNGPGGQH